MMDDKTQADTPPEEGDYYVHTRTFSVDEVRQFSELSNDTQPRHVEKDDQGRLLVHGLLTASILTKIGGDLEMLAHSLNLTFERPVFTGEEIRCTWRNEQVTEEAERYQVTAAVTCRNPRDEVVLEAIVDGYIS